MGIFYLGGIVPSNALVTTNDGILGGGAALTTSASSLNYSPF